MCGSVQSSPAMLIRIALDDSNLQKKIKTERVNTLSVLMVRVLC